MLFKKLEVTLRQKFVSARLDDLWNGVDDITVAVGSVTAFKCKPGHCSTFHGNL